MIDKRGVGTPELVEALAESLGRQPRICILSYSQIPDDPRVRRQGEAFCNAGWEVSAVSLPGWLGEAPSWPILTWNQLDDLEALAATKSATSSNNHADHEQAVSKMAGVGEDATAPIICAPSNPKQGTTAPLRPTFGLLIRGLVQEYLPLPVQIFLRRTYGFLLSVLRLFIRGYSLTLNAVRSASQNLSRPVLNVIRNVLNILSVYRDAKHGPKQYLQVGEINRFYRTARFARADLYLANDWHMLPIAMRLAEENEVQFCYDTHEYALEEYRYQLKWRLTKMPLVRSIESLGLTQSLVSSAVSKGIADDMKREYDLTRDMMVIRNTPEYSKHKSGPTTKLIDVLYHGIITNDRGLEECVESVALWRSEFRLILRGPGQDEVIDKLKDVARNVGVEDRVVFAPPVPMLDLVDIATEADIGLSTPPKTSKHNIFALPNKLFEYIQAGLAICVCDLPDMAHIVTENKLGLLIDEVTPESIAMAINKFDRKSIDRFKANARKASETLCWSNERERLIATYSCALLESLSGTDTAPTARIEIPPEIRPAAGDANG